MSDQSLLDLWLSIPAVWEDGLSESQLQYAEAVYGFRFPADYRSLLSQRLPVAEVMPDGSQMDSFPDWREPHTVVERMNWPWFSLCIDIAEYNQFWLEKWGEKLKDVRDCMQVVRDLFDNAPTLIPIYGHRYIPEGPNKGNPVLSVYQTDIIVYGWNLESYLKAEFFSQPADSKIPDSVMKLGLWDDIMFAD